MWDSYYGMDDMQQAQTSAMQMQNMNYGMPRVKYTKTQIIGCLRECICQCYKVYVTSEEKLEDMPMNLRHACSSAGVTFLPIGQFPVPEMGLVVPYYFCSSCGKLFFVNDFMN